MKPAECPRPLNQREFHKIELMKCKYICLLLLFVAGNIYASSQNDSLLNLLNKTIEKASTYDAEKIRQIDVLRKELHKSGHLSLPERYALCQQLYEQYKVFKYDSAFAYARQLQALARQMNDPARINYAGLKLGFVLLSSGMFKETGDYLATIDVAALPDTARAEYYTLKGR
jgi:hypothetical protein